MLPAHSLVREPGKLARRAVAAAFVLAALAFPGIADAAARRVAAVSLVVSDLDRSVDFYTRVLGFEGAGQKEVLGEDRERLEGLFGLRMRVATLRLGDERIELRQFLAPKGRPFPADSRSNDRWFQHIAIVVRDMDEAYRRLRAAGVDSASTGPQRLPDWNPNAGGIEAFYFKDPDSHVLEVIHFPKGKGDPKWQAPAAALFLGIDHTAIVVRDTDASLRFWRDTLGLRVAGESENFGPEQERLNNVFGARLRITGLRAPSGPGVELLEYLAPGDGRPYPPDTRANDLWSWQTELEAEALEPLSRSIRASGGTWVSPGALAVGGDGGTAQRALVARDPDGHAVSMFEPAGRASTDRPDSPAGATTAPPSATSEWTNPHAPQEAGAR